jgi:osmotically-inducible protein OsmY
MEFAKDRPAGDTLTDVRISTKIKAELAKTNFRELFTKIKIEVVQGRVFYTGLVKKEEDIITAVQIAWNQPDVVEVVNELKVDKNSGNFNLVRYTRDTLITSQIKSKTFVERDIKFVNYTVITLNDVVYLFGIARSEEELEKVAKIASNINGVEKVISHVKVMSAANKIRPAGSGNSDSINNDLIIDNKDEDPEQGDASNQDW